MGVSEHSWICTEHCCHLRSRLSLRRGNDLPQDAPREGGQVRALPPRNRKEIENYLLEPKVLERAARKAVEERARRTGAVVTVDFDIVGMLEAITTTLKSECSGQYVGKYSAYVKAGGKDPATLATEALTIFEKKWSALESRLEIVPGKDVLRSVRDRLQESHEITLTDWRIIDCYKAEEVPHDLAALLRRLDAFRSGREEG